MKCFLSYRSTQGQYADTVATFLGAAACNYDKFAFRAGVPVKRNELMRVQEADLFVVLISRDLFESEDVERQLAFARDRMSQVGSLHFLPIIIDDTPFSSVPLWIREFTIERISSPDQCCSRIVNYIQNSQLASLLRPHPFVDRDEELARVQDHLALPADRRPRAIAVTGWNGVGRRAFLQELVNRTYPLVTVVRDSVIVERGASLDDFYRSLLVVGGPIQLVTLATLTEQFSKLPPEEKLTKCIDLIASHSTSKRMLLISGGGTQRDEDGRFVAWLHDIILQLPLSAWPLVAIIQGRRVPPEELIELPRITEVRLGTLANDDIGRLLRLRFADSKIDYDDTSVRKLASACGGSPQTANFAVALAESDGIEMLVQQLHRISDFQRKHGSIALSRIQLTDAEESVLFALVSYRYVDLETLAKLTDLPRATVVEAVRTLLGWSIIERVGADLRITPFLTPAIERRNWNIQEKERQDQHKRMLEFLASLGAGSFVAGSVIESGAAIIASGESFGQSEEGVWLHLVLPSHFLRAARRAYDRRDLERVIELTSSAFEYGPNLSEDGRIEALRLRGLAASRLGDAAIVQNALDELRKSKRALAQRHFHFISGYNFRLRGKDEKAEAEQKTALQFKPNDFHILRELANCLANQESWAEAEQVARAAYSIRPQNPFIIHILARILLQSPLNRGNPDVETEVSQLMESLRTSDEDINKSFYEELLVWKNLRAGRLNDALDHVERAIEKTPDLMQLFGLRAQINLRLGEYQRVEADIENMKKMVARSKLAGGHEMNGRIDATVARLMIARHQVGNAIAFVRGSSRLSTKTKKRLFTDLSEEIEKMRAAGVTVEQDWVSAIREQL